MIEELSQTYPEADIVWTIEFQGSDAETVGERNSETGLVDHLRGLNDRGLVEFGYHAHHDPTYQNRLRTSSVVNLTTTRCTTPCGRGLPVERTPSAEGASNPAEGGSRPYSRPLAK